MSTESNSVALNQQAPEHTRDNPDTLDVHSWFYTVQGEGPFSGLPAVFLRLAGCNLQCPLCDTNYTVYRQEYEHKELLEKLLKTSPTELRPILVITGGEPYRQRGIFSFIKQAAPYFPDIQVETNGCYSIGSANPYNLTIVCSPKTIDVHRNVMTFVNNWKYVMNAKNVDPNDGLPTSVLGYRRSPARPPLRVPKTNILLQPEDSRFKDLNEENLQACVASCMKYGYRLCLQVQKICGLP